jgi:hypothetical protein
MSPNTKFALAAALVLSTASSGLANDIATSSSEAQGAITCPTLEGYPDCHPDDHVSSRAHSTSSRLPVRDRSRR